VGPSNALQGAWCVVVRWSEPSPDVIHRTSLAAPPSPLYQQGISCIPVLLVPIRTCTHCTHGWCRFWRWPVFGSVGCVDASRRPIGLASPPPHPCCRASLNTDTRCYRGHGHSVIFCEAVAIYGVVVAILLATKTEAVVALENGDFPAHAKTAGYAIFAAGGTVGFANLVCGYAPASLAPGALWVCVRER
jgi:F0F1-type ATP synthase membrane subunit c/vacuolar-type H+-ATPase subunit K